jgi:hypothetical protein
MKQEMRKKLAREPFEEKIRKVAQLIRLAKTFPPALGSPQDKKAPTPSAILNVFIFNGGMSGSFAI